MIVFAPNPTGSGHNMRALSIGQAIKRLENGVPLTVALGSLQNIFTPLFQESDIDVVDIAGELVDYSKKSNLSKTLDWSNYIGGYIANTFMSGERVLFYLSLIDKLKPEVLVSDYNMAACQAAIISGVPLAFVTERYDFTLCQLSDEELTLGGFDVNEMELERARVALHRQFDWMIRHSRLILTDKPYIESLDGGTPVEAALNSGLGHFVGPMIREVVAHDTGSVRAELGIGDAPYIIASISGTTMFQESKQALLDAYIEGYRILKEQRPDLKMVLLGRSEVEGGDGVISVPYYPKWSGLLKEASLLLSAPGWITVTEIAALKIPTLFVLPSNSEYHEVEAQKRLGLLGFPTYVGCDKNELANIVESELRKDKDEKYFQAHLKVAAPDWRGADRAAAMILDVAHSSSFDDRKDVRRAG